jgi:DNA-binding MltR family transcriptional regulator
MAAKGSKIPSYFELMKTADLFSKIPKGKTLIDVEKLDKLIKDENRIEAINWVSSFDNSLKILLILHFSQRDKEVKTLMNNINMIQKARLAYALGLFDKTALKNFAQIHDIRNRFAHNLGTSFADSKVLKFVRNLSTTQGRKVTEKNSYEFYISALEACLKNIVDAFQQEVYRQAALMSAKKKKE